MEDEEGRSPCVRAFVANFERRDSNAGIENKPPVMTKSKVALLRQTLGKSSDSVKGTSSDSEGSSKIHDAGDSDGAGDSSEHVISVARLKENLQKSASEKPQAPWAFGGAGRPVKEPKKPTSKRLNDAEVEVKSAKIDNPPNTGDRTKRRLNSSFKRSQQNLIESPVRTESLDENVFFGDSGSNQSDSSQIQFNRSISGEYQTGVKHKPAPKVLPKPIPRKSKAKAVNVSHERSQSDDKCERTAYQNKNTTLESSSNTTANRNDETMLGSSALNGQTSAPSEALRPESDETSNHQDEFDPQREMDHTVNTVTKVAGEAVRNATKEPHDIDSVSAKPTQSSDAHRTTSLEKLRPGGHLETGDQDLVSSTDARNAIPPVATRTRSSRSVGDENSDDNDEREVNNPIITQRSTTNRNDNHIPPDSPSDHRISSEMISTEQNICTQNIVSSERSTDLVTSDDESVMDDKKCSKTTDESIMLSGENGTESPDEDRTNSISLSQDSTKTHSNLLENGNEIKSEPTSECDDSAEDSRFRHCMGPDFVTNIKELSSTTMEESEYEALATIVCCKMLEKEEERYSWLLCPPDTYKSTMDYVGSLFKDDILVDIGERKFGTWTVGESSFMSSDSLREALLDKATKKLESLKLQKQRLEVAAAKQIELEELVDVLMKVKVDSRQYSKYRSTLEEFDQVTHLLLMLSSRLANTDNALDQISFSDHDQQKVQLLSKRENLIEKFKEARSIKESSETRRRQLASCLQQRLNTTEFFDYQQLIKTRCQLKVVGHSLEDRISLSEEQIKILVAIIEKSTSARYC